MTEEHKHDVVFQNSRKHRWQLMLLVSVFTVFVGILPVGFGVQKLLWPFPEQEAGDAWFLLGIGTIVLVGSGLFFYFRLWEGEIRFQFSEVSIWRHVIPYDSVLKWGTVTVMENDHPDLILVFRVKPNRIIRHELTGYENYPAILAEFNKRLPPANIVELPYFWGEPKFS